jgi:Fur family ferric uptake transcriptional regulator
VSTSAEDRLRAAGHRVTPQRVAVLEALETLRHGTPDEIHAEVCRHHEINLSTVYRTLELLNEIGLVRHAHLSDRAPTYHSVSGHEHAHLVCRGCGASRSLTRQDLDLSALERSTGFAVDFGHLSVFGLCGECQR